MREVEQKLARALALVERAGDDEALLGMALLAAHGALEAHLRATLSARQDLTPDERRRIDVQAVSGAPLLALVQRYTPLGRDQQALVEQAGALRRDLARGAPLRATPELVARYVRFVEAQCGLGGSIDAALAEHRRAQAQEAELPPPAPAAPRGISLAGLLVLALLIVVLLVAGRVIYDQLDLGRTLSGLLVDGPPTVTPGPPPTPLPPTPRPRTAQIVRLGGGPGWLREAASFTSATLPPRLSEGTEVTLLDEQAADSDGNLWRLVSYDGYDGWCPANNLELRP